MKADFDKAGAQIVVMSFGSRSAAVKWQQDTSCRYPILLDPERQVRRCVVPYGSKCYLFIIW